jgi:hypothetical protein
MKTKKQKRVLDTAMRMINTYTTIRVARDMASFHAADHKPGSKQYGYWMKVAKTIDKLAKAGVRRQ